MDTFFCSPCNSVNNSEGDAARLRQLSLAYEITTFQGYRNSIYSQNKAHSW